MSRFSKNFFLILLIVVIISLVRMLNVAGISFIIFYHYSFIPSVIAALITLVVTLMVFMNKKKEKAFRKAILVGSIVFLSGIGFGLLYTFRLFFL